VRDAVHDRFARQLGAVQEEQEADGHGGEPFEEVRDAAAGGQQACKGHDRDEREREVVGEKA
jgi:hypothetical protein